MPKVADEIENARESYAEYVLGLLAQAEEGDRAALAKLQDRLFALAPGDQSDLIAFLVGKGFLQVVGDEKENQALFLTEQGRDRAKLAL
jgi:hypothetical protein